MKRKINVLLVGKGGRECALAKKIESSSLLDKLYVSEYNPGFPENTILINFKSMTDEDILKLNLGLVIVGPEKPLSEGITDRFINLKIPVFGPTKLAAQLETSKLYAKRIMNELSIPTAKFKSFSLSARFMQAKEYINGPCVVKVDGLAAGKGVYVCNNEKEGHDAVNDIGTGKYGISGAHIIVEEKLIGKEASIIAICDGENSIMLPSCRDYKKRYDNDEGPNTGGMGVICPVPTLDDKFLKEIQESIVNPILKKMKEKNSEFRGALYVGLILTNDGPKVLEFNVRFGDPECQALMLMIEDDFLLFLLEAANGKIKKNEVSTKKGSVCCVVLCNKDYPIKGSSGNKITFDSKERTVYLSGTKINDKNELLTNGGRIMTVCAYGENIKAARDNVFKDIEGICFDKMDYRKDIGALI